MTIFESAGRMLDAIAKRSFHPILASVVPGSGLGAGFALRINRTGDWRVNAEAIGTIRDYVAASVAAGFLTPRLSAEVYVAARDLQSLEFFGPGTASARDTRSNYQLRDRSAGVRASQRLATWLAVEGGFEQLWVDVSPGESRELPSIEAVFDESDAPGLTRQPRFGKYRAGLRIGMPAASGNRFNQGGVYHAAYTLFDDQEGAQYSFARWEVEGRQRFAPFGNLHRLTVHGWLSTSDAKEGQQVPFYMQRTLGGQTFSDESERALGSDGTMASLRGFPNYRFRDRHALLLQAEYRVPFWGPVDVSLFADAGKVAGSWNDLNFSDLKSDAGAGLSVMRGPATAIRFDVAFFGEGVRMFVTVGQLLLP
jgi:hypothetical protein